MEFSLETLRAEDTAIVQSGRRRRIFIQATGDYQAALHSRDGQDSEVPEMQTTIAANADSVRTRYGSCLCQAIRYELVEEPFRRVLCHCIECKKATGSAFMANSWYNKDVSLQKSFQEVVQSYLISSVAATSDHLRTR
jgi:Glutathione-dependent formaldehyde-activating enzyme